MLHSSSCCFLLFSLREPVALLVFLNLSSFFLSLVWKMKLTSLVRGEKYKLLYQVIGDVNENIKFFQKEINFLRKTPKGMAGRRRDNTDGFLLTFCRRSERQSVSAWEATDSTNDKTRESLVMAGNLALQGRVMACSEEWQSVSLTWPTARQLIVRNAPDGEA
jgi:hypothetical protein